jgi:hypothetical protein
LIAVAAWDGEGVIDRGVPRDLERLMTHPHVHTVPLIAGRMSTSRPWWRADEAEVATVAADWVGRMYDALHVVHHFETAFGHTLVRGFLLDDALEVDVAFAPTAGFRCGSRWQSPSCLLYLV